MGDAGEADCRARPALDGLPGAHEDLAGPARRHGDRRRRGRRRARPGDRPSPARGREGRPGPGHGRHQGRDPDRAGRGGAAADADDLPAPRAAIARKGGNRPDRTRRRPARGRQMAACRRRLRRHRGERRPMVRHDRPAARSTRLSRRRGHAALDGRRARLRRGRLRDGAEASPAQGRRIRGAPRTAACGEPAPCPVGQAPEPFVPQTRYLSIIGNGDGRALATRGWWAIEGAWVWRWKDHVDRRWIQLYQRRV